MILASTPVLPTEARLPGGRTCPLGRGAQRSDGTFFSPSQLLVVIPSAAKNPRISPLTTERSDAFIPAQTRIRP